MFGAAAFGRTTPIPVVVKTDPITGDSANVTYTYPAGKGIYAVDMTQINSGIGSSKKLISVSPQAHLTNMMLFTMFI